MNPREAFSKSIVLSKEGETEVVILLLKGESFL